MINDSAEKIVAKFLYFGVPLVTLLVIAGPGADPVNVTKLMPLGVIACGIGFVLLFQGRNFLWSGHKLIVVSITAFLVFSTSAVFFSKSPLIQNIYGASGRNTGFITYMFFSFLLLGAVSIRNLLYFKKILLGFFFAGLINVIYGLWVWQFGDFMPWNNVYGNFLGTFGNPNFSGAFLGMFFCAVIAYGFDKNTSKKVKILIPFLSLIIFFEILKTHAVQGLVVAAGGLGIIGFFLLCSRVKGWLIPSAYLTILSIIGVFALLGALQKGPLTQFIYKRSVSLRGSYWNAGLEMGKKHPWNGVGMDAYGDWYSRARSEIAATTTPGIGVTSSASHNVLIDFFAYGGYPLFLSYISMIGLAAYAIIKVFKRNREFDGIFVALATAWICYQVQSVISINQIGLAIWGWVLTGILLSYEIATRPVAEISTHTAKKSLKSKNKINKKNQGQELYTGIIAAVGMVFGFLISVPPFSADVKWSSALKSHKVEKVEAALTPTYFAPSDSLRLANSTSSFEQNKLPDQGVKYARYGVKFNPDFLDAWRMLYYATKSTPEEKAEAKKQLIRLDPRNPEWKKLS